MMLKVKIGAHANNRSGLVGILPAVQRRGRPITIKQQHEWRQQLEWASFD